MRSMVHPEKTLLQMLLRLSASTQIQLPRAGALATAISVNPELVKQVRMSLDEQQMITPIPDTYFGTRSIY